MKCQSCSKHSQSVNQRLNSSESILKQTAYPGSFFDPGQTDRHAATFLVAGQTDRQLIRGCFLDPGQKDRQLIRGCFLDHSIDRNHAHTRHFNTGQKCVTTVLKPGLATPLYPPLIYSLLYILSFFLSGK